MVSSSSTCNADIGGIVSTAARAELSGLRRVASKREWSATSKVWVRKWKIKNQAHLKLVWTKTHQYLAGGAELGLEWVQVQTAAGDKQWQNEIRLSKDKCREGRKVDGSQGG